MVNTSEIVEQYTKLWPGSQPSVAVRSPGRVNLIGEHVDYCDGFVLPMAMSHALHVIAGMADDGAIAVRSTAFDETVAFSAIEPGPPADPFWSNYVRGVAAMLIERGIGLPGARLLIHSEVPIGGGVSSSAALEVGAAMALLALAGGHLDPVELALLARRAEHEYARSPCGIMDQFICVLGKADHALLLDCRTRAFDQIPLPMTDATLMVMNTQVRHAIGSSQYPVRQEQCREGLAALQRTYPEVVSLRDGTREMLETSRHAMDEVVYRRCRHVISEIARTQRAADALRGGDLATFGRHMFDSHASLRDDYEVSCDELDALVAITGDLEGVYGARMTGGGFGGCAIALVRRDAEAALRKTVSEKYDGRFEHPAIVYDTRPSDGARVRPL